MKIIISNIVTLNMGDAAILMGEIETLKRAFGPDTRFVIFDAQPEATAKYYPDYSFRKQIYLKLPGVYRRVRFIGHAALYLSMIWLCLGALALRFKAKKVARFIIPKSIFEDLAEYYSADLIVSTGGTILVENYNVKSKIFDFMLTLLMGKPLVLFTQSLGPFHKKMNRFWLKLIFNRARLILLRDQKSKQHLIDIGVDPSNLFVCADAAFVLADKDALTTSRMRLDDRRQSTKVAISVREWPFFKRIQPEAGIERFINSMRDLCVHLVQHHGAKITFLSTCQGVPEYWMDDAKFASKIIDRLPIDIRAHVALNDQWHSPQAIMKLLKQFDWAISTRLHMGILSLCTGIPVLSIAYEFKTKELFKRLDIPEYVLDIEEMEPDDLIKRADEFIDSLPGITRPLFEAVEREHMRAIQAEHILKRKLRFDFNP